MFSQWFKKNQNQNKTQQELKEFIPGKYMVQINIDKQKPNNIVYHFDTKNVFKPIGSSLKFNENDIAIANTIISNIQK